MDPTLRDQLRDDLRGTLDGELILDGLHCALYATDASLFEVTPLAVVRPRHDADVQAVVRYAAEHQLSVTARGAGTGTAGSALGPGIVLDFSRFLNGILEIGADSVRVQAGATWENVNDRLIGCGRQLAIEPAGSSAATIGGIVSGNVSGPRLARLGYPRDHVTAVKAVLDNGELVDLNGRGAESAPQQTDRWRNIEAATIALLQRSSAMIAGERPRAPFNRCGYLLHDVQADGKLNAPRLLAGTEGTLALFTEITLRTSPISGGRAVILMICADLDSAILASRRILLRNPTACELLDGRLVSLMRGSRHVEARRIPSNAGAAILVEFDDDSLSRVRKTAIELIDELVQEQLALLAVPAWSAAEQSQLWDLARHALTSLAILRGGPPAVIGIEDIAIPVADVQHFLPLAYDALRRHDTTAACLVHAAAGQIELRPFLDPTVPEDAARLWAIAEDIFKLTLGFGGTISSRFGTGLARTPWVAKQYPNSVAVFRELKAIFDPRDILNPGCIVGPDPRRPAWPLRRPNPPTDKPLRDSQADGDASDRNSTTELLVWKPGVMAAQIAACHGCGQCRADAAPQRMCPTFRATHAEEASPRAKANLLRELLRPGIDRRHLSDSEVRKIADLCVNCKMCVRECPANVDIPKLMLETKAAHVAEHGLDRNDWVMARLSAISALGSTAAIVANQLLRGPISRWIMEKFFGISRRRRLPQFTGRSFLRRAKRWGWTLPPRLADARSADRVALFVDFFANHHDPGIAEAAVRVLKLNGVAVFVPPDQRSCGMEALAQGDVETAREIARDNLRIFADLARSGYRIVCTEPTAAVMLRQDYLDLLDDPDARVLSDATTELTAYLWELHERGRLRTDFKPLAIGLGHHIPCHIKALDRPAFGPRLLRLIPGSQVHTIDVGCSGMAGTYGLRVGGYEASMAAGQRLFEELRRPRVLFGSTECSACRIQMEHGAGKRTLHPGQYLALSYGLMPELGQRLQTRVKDAVIQ